MSAFSLVGRVYSVIFRKKSEARDSLIEEVHYSLISIFLHFNDESDIVKQACASSLKDFSNILGESDIM